MLGRLNDLERFVLNIEDPCVLQAVSKLVSYCHQVFVLLVILIPTNTLPRGLY